MPARADSSLSIGRMRRRRFLGTALAGGGVAFAAACGGQKSRTDDASTSSGAGALATLAAGQAAPGAGEQVKRGGTLSVHVSTTPPRSLDPHFETFPSSSSVFVNVYNTLLRFVPDLSKIEPEAAAAMPEQPDDRTYVFKLRPGIKYHNVAPTNGRELTAEDIKYSIERQSTNTPGKFQHAYYFLDRLDRIEAVDKSTIRFVTKQPYAPFISYAASPWTVIISKEVVEQNGDLTTKAVGTGPFIFDEWQKDVQIKMRRNPEYWGKDTNGGQLPYIDTLIQKDIRDSNSVQAQFVSGGLMATPDIQFTFVDQVRKQLPKANYRMVPSQFPKQMRTAPYDGEKIQQKPRFADIRIRQALAQAVNKKEVLDLVYSGDGVTQNGPILPLFPQWALKDDPVKYDPEASKQLLAAAGVPNGWEDEFIFSSNSAGDTQSQIAEVLQRQLARIGVRATLRPMDSTAYFNKNYSYDYTMSLHTPLNLPEPDENLSPYFGPNATFYRWGNKEIHALIEKQVTTLNTSERQKAVEETQRKIIADYPMTFILTNNRHYFTQPQVKGWFFSNDLYDGRAETAWIDPSA
jgi:peptide/nickel transport system substrate-binding protein